MDRVDTLFMPQHIMDGTEPMTKTDREYAEEIMRAYRNLVWALNSAVSSGLVIQQHGMKPKDDNPNYFEEQPVELVRLTVVK